MCDLPSWVLCLPALHAVHSVEPLAAYLPLGQVSHIVTLLAPTAALKVPPEQSTHALLPGAAWYLPGAHLVCAQLPAVATLKPSVAAVHDVSESPPSQLGAPALQPRNVPLEHSLHTVEPFGDHWPHLQ